MNWKSSFDPLTIQAAPDRTLRRSGLPRRRSGDVRPGWGTSLRPSPMGKSPVSQRRRAMAKGKKQGRGRPTERERRAKLTARESLKRLQEFAERRDHFVAAVRNGKNRYGSA